MNSNLKNGLVRDGDALSCFTTSISQLLHNLNIDYREIIGSQLAFYISINTDENNTNKLLFSHYHTPLNGGAHPNSFSLKRCSTIDKHEAIARVTSQIQQHGSVIVCGDSFNIPWLVKYKKVHTPHWFVVAAINDRTQYLVQDAFAYLDYQGQQLPHSSWICQEILVQCLQEATDIDEAVHNRETFAFSTNEFDELVCQKGCQWYELQLTENHENNHHATFREKMRNNANAMLGKKSQPIDRINSWQSGIHAIQQLQEYVDANLTNSHLYGYVDDIWVASRTRSMYLRYLKQHKGDLEEIGLESTISYFEKNIVNNWVSLIKIMHYNKDCLARAKKVRPLSVSLLGTIKNFETGYAEQLLASLNL